MKKIPFLLILLGLVSLAHAQSMVKTKDVVGAGAVNARTADGTIRVQGTVGQAIIGYAANTGGAVVQGFWTPALSPAGIEVAHAGPAPVDFVLDQNYPNPYSASTAISFAVPSAQRVTLQVWSMTGMLVKTLVDDQMEAGKYTVTFDGSGLMAGTYLYTMRSAGNVITKRMVVIR